MRKLRCLTKAAMLRIVHTGSRSLNRGDYRRRDPAIFSGEGLGLSDRTLHHLRLLNHITMFFGVSVSNAQQYASKAGTAVAVLGWKVCAAVKRYAVQ